MACVRLMVLSATLTACTAAQLPDDPLRPGTDPQLPTDATASPTSTPGPTGGTTTPPSDTEPLEPLAITDLGYRPIDAGDPLIIEPCTITRPPGARGDCFTFSYPPVSWDWPQGYSAALFFAKGAEWGYGPTGIEIPPGATSLQFQVKAEADDVYAYYLAGLDDSDSGKFQDGWTVQLPDPPLPADPEDRALRHPGGGNWQTVSIDLTDQSYTEIKLPFALVIPNDLESEPGAFDYEELNSPFETHVVSIDDIVITF
ncbi:MAG: hypothetical protein KTR31_17285 [Myxococcales bacterium]|nr:hypothetical protein [Myxococcales bacterium]